MLWLAGKPHKLTVGGSNPPPATKISDSSSIGRALVFQTKGCESEPRLSLLFKVYAAVAKIGQRRFPFTEVIASSSLVSSTGLMPYP